MLLLHLAGMPTKLCHPPAWLTLFPAGIVCVGGDGIFHESLNGLLEARAAAAASTEPGAAELAALLGGLRLAHIPAGSTDAVACTLHGTRSPFTAAMHVCLGDSCLLDVLRVDTASTTQFASCIAGEQASGGARLPGRAAAM